MAEFLSAFRRTIAIEGGWSNDPADPGGETYCGISRVYWPSWEGWRVVDGLRLSTGFPKILAAQDDLTRHLRNFYEAQLWQPLRADGIAEQPIAEQLFDAATLHGRHRAAQFLQAAMNLLNAAGARYPDIAEDGVMGPTTLATVRLAVEANGAPLVHLTQVLVRSAALIGAMREHPAKERYARGWLARLELRVVPAAS